MSSVAYAITDSEIVEALATKTDAPSDVSNFEKLLSDDRIHNTFTEIANRRNIDKLKPKLRQIIATHIQPSAGEGFGAILLTRLGVSQEVTKAWAKQTIQEFGNSSLLSDKKQVWMAKVVSCGTEELLAMYESEASLQNKYSWMLDSLVWVRGSQVDDLYLQLIDGSKDKISGFSDGADFFIDAPSKRSLKLLLIRYPELVARKNEFLLKSTRSAVSVERDRLAKIIAELRSGR